MEEPEWKPVVGFAVIPLIRKDKLRANVIYSTRADAMRVKNRRKGKCWIVKMNCLPIKDEK